MGSKLNERSRNEFSVHALGLFVLVLAVTILEIQAACPPENNCESCQDNGTCIKCIVGYGYNSSTGYCEPCGSSCLECSPIGRNCTQCRVTFGPAFNSTDASCGRCMSENCDFGCSEQGAGKCDRCNAEYGPNPTFTECIQCVENCQSCVSNTSYCDTCKFGYSLFDPGNKTCGVCSKYCKKHGCLKEGPGFCKECDIGYVFFRNNKTCGECAANCSSCVVSGAGQCDNCTFGYGLTPTNTCAPCSANCTTYGCNITGAYKCDECDSGYGLLQNGSCDKCAANCFSCVVSGASKCDNCTFGYGLTPTNTCATCSAHCTTYGCAINGAGKCDRCDLGFELTSTKTCATITTTRIPTTTQIPTTTSNAPTTTVFRSTHVSSKDVSGTTTKDSGSNSESLVSGEPTSPLSFSPSDEIDWRILLTLLMLLFGGLLITLFSFLFWMARFYRISGPRRRLYMVKES